MSQRFTLTVKFEEGRLYMNARRRKGKTILYPVSDNKFITTDAGSVYTFVKDDTGKITELIMQRERSDQPRRATRIE